MPNYNKMSKRYNRETEEIIEQINEIIPQPVEVAPEVEEFVPEVVVVKGVVAGCAQMYVRSEASVNSEPLGIIKCDTKVEIHESESTAEFYSVSTETGLEGFCMKKFIAIL